MIKRNPEFPMRAHYKGIWLPGGRGIWPEIYWWDKLLMSYVDKQNKEDIESKIFTEKSFCSFFPLLNNTDR